MQLIQCLAKVSEMRYKPWGEVRYHWVDSNLSTTPAYTLPKYTFTGQRSYMDDPSTSGVEGFGLMDYNARMYAPAIGRFVSADTDVPASQGVQAFDRYAYVNNSPMRFTDPTGHMCSDPDDETQECDGANNVGERSYTISRTDEEIVKGATVKIHFVTVPLSQCDLKKRVCPNFGGMGTVVSNAHTIVSAQHVIDDPEHPSSSNPPTIYGIVVVDAFGNTTLFDINDVQIDLSTSGDIMTITLPTDLPDVTPATPGSGIYFAAGSPAHVGYNEGKNGPINVLTTTITEGEHLTWTPYGGYGDNTLPPFGQYGTVANPGSTLIGGDSGGGVFVNGFFVGVISTNEALFYPYP